MRIEYTITDEGARHITLGGMHDMERSIEGMTGVHRVLILDARKVVIHCDADLVFTIMNYVRNETRGCVEFSVTRKAKR